MCGRRYRSALPITTSTSTNATRNLPPPPSKVYTSYAAGQLLDITGDGIPDWVGWTGSGMKAYIGTGTSFRADAINVTRDVGPFVGSGHEERCDENSSTTVGGLYDIDRDGVPALVVREHGRERLDRQVAACRSIPVLNVENVESLNPKL